MSLNEITKFNFNQNEINTITDDNGEPWFIAKDMCAVLDIVDVSQAVSRLDDDEKLLRTLHVAGQNREVLLISESGLYSITLRSNKPQAKPFQKWVTKEVLPTIRKTGSYSITPKQEIHDPQIAAMIVALEAVDKLKKQQAETDERLKKIESKQQAIEDGADYFTVVGYAVWKGLRVDMSAARSIGKIAAKISDSEGVPVDEVRDPRFGKINAYHEAVLEKAIAKFMKH